jgi:hypothetical protein
MTRGGQCTGGVSIVQMPPLATTVSGASSVTFSGHAYGRGGGGLHVGCGLPGSPCGHSTLNAASQPSLVLKIVQRVPSEGALGRGRGGLAMTVGGGDGDGDGDGDGGGDGDGRGGFAITVGGGAVCSTGAGGGGSCGGGAEEEVKHAGAAARVTTNGRAKDRRGVRADMRGG